MADRQRRGRVRRLDQPKGVGRRLALRIDDDTIGRWSERIARFFGTSQYLVIQSLVVLVWIVLNSLVVTRTIRWDPYPFILLNLAFSTQAAYAAPLILLAQNRQSHRDRISLEEDRAQNAREAANMEYLAREIASIRIALGEVATRDFLRAELHRLAIEAQEENGPAERDQGGQATPPRGAGIP